MVIKLIGNKIAEARKKMGMSQAQLAEQISISPQAVGKWERGESIPDMVTCCRLAEIFGVDLNYFTDYIDMPASSLGSVQENAPLPGTHIESIPVAPANRQNHFSGSNLPQSDLAGVIAHKSTFNGSALRGSDFSEADLTGSIFKVSDAREANFYKTKLTGCTFSILNLAAASFNESVLLRTEFSKCDMTGVKFSNLELQEVKFNVQELKGTEFHNCVFNAVRFKHCDLRGQCFDGQQFIDVSFDKTDLTDVTFRDATLKNITFIAPFALTNKYYKSIKTICFDGAKMDKLTYAKLKGWGADLANVTLITR